MEFYMKTGQEILNATHVQEAMKIMYPFGLEKVVSTEQALKQLGVYDYRTIDALIATAESEDMIWTLVDETAHEILIAYQSLGEDKKHQIRWGEHKQKIIKELQMNHFTWFEQAEKEVDRLDFVSEMEGKIKNALNKAKKNTSALISTEREANNLKLDIERTFFALKDIINSNEVSLRDTQIQSLIEKVDQAIEEAIAFVDVKLEEKPTHILYYRTGSRVSVKVNLQRNGYSYRQGRGKEIRYNKGEDRSEFPLIVSVNYIEDFLYINDVRDEDIYVDPKSVEHFYTFDNKVSVNLTPSFIAEWYNYDCPVLVRHTPNKYRHVNMLGMPICHFSHTLVESTWSEDYISKDMTEDEANRLMADYGHTRISREIRNMLTARRLERSGELDQMEQFVKEFDSKVQAVINKHEKEILVQLSQRLGAMAELKTGTDGVVSITVNENSFGLDCGYINISCADSEYTQKRSILRNARSYSPWMEIRLPYEGQSVTVKRMQFDIIKGMVEKELGITLYAHTTLD